MSEDWGDVDPGEDEQAELFYGSVAEFVSNYLVRIYRRDITKKGVYWCREWWQHAEAIARLTAMWLAWEALRLEAGTGPSNWWLGHADPHMRVLLSDDGPFAYCRESVHVDERYMDLPETIPPADLFPDQRGG